MLQKKLKVVHKAGELSGNNIADAVTKFKIQEIWSKSKKYWRNNYSSRSKRWNIKLIEKNIIKI